MFADRTCFCKKFHLRLICSHSWKVGLWHTRQTVLGDMRLHLMIHLPYGFTGDFFVLRCRRTPSHVLCISVVNSCDILKQTHHAVNFYHLFRGQQKLTPPSYTHNHLTGLSLGLPRWAGTRKVKPIWILLKQERVSGNGIRWAIFKSALRSRQITTPAPHHSVFYRPDALPAAKPTVSKHWRQCLAL